MADSPTDFDKMFRDLQRDYLTLLPERLRETRESVEKARTQSDPAAADKVRESFHKLRGTGASFGLQEVTDAGAIGENAILAFKTDPGAKVWDDIEGALRTLEAAVARGV